jgi:hypothetical protein
MLAVLAAAVTAVLILSVANGTFKQHGANQVVLLLGFGAFMVVGALIVTHRPSNAIGWIFSVIGLLVSTGGWRSNICQYAYVTRPRSLPGATLAAWYSSWTWYSALAPALVFTPLLFPTGRLLAPMAASRLASRGHNGDVHRAGCPGA